MLNYRFDAKHRVYKYFFPRGNLKIEAMREAGARLIGTHDFRNMCKMDIVNVSNFVRTILAFELTTIGHAVLGGTTTEICEVQLTGQAFLWHQVSTTLFPQFPHTRISPNTLSILTVISRCDVLWLCYS